MFESLAQVNYMISFKCLKFYFTVQVELDRLKKGMNLTF